MAGRKFYVVWEGRMTGIFDTWSECKASVEGHQGAKYKSFATREEAVEAFRTGFVPTAKCKTFRTATTQPNPISLSVDAACSGNPGRMEYRGVFTNSGTELFHQGVFDDATNNIGEFLAIVHGLAFLKKQNLPYPIYSDSVSAISWVRAKKCKTKLLPSAQNQAVFDLIARAEKWLRENDYPNMILKWDTPQWGEIPADFGRK